VGGPGHVRVGIILSQATIRRRASGTRDGRRDGGEWRGRAGPAPRRERCDCQCCRACQGRGQIAGSIARLRHLTLAGASAEEWQCGTMAQAPAHQSRGRDRERERGRHVRARCRQARPTADGADGAEHALPVVHVAHVAHAAHAFMSLKLGAHRRLPVLPVAAHTGGTYLAFVLSAPLCLPRCTGCCAPLHPETARATASPQVPWLRCPPCALMTG
jgi:hypothetical protein